MRNRWRAYSSSGGTTTAAATGVSPSSKSPQDPDAGDSAAPGTRKPATHLCVLVHGLWGRPSDWDVVAERLDEHKQRLEAASSSQRQRESLRVLKSRANARRLTLDGIDVCARRLAAEVRAAVAEERERFCAEAKLERVSFVGHSMGGLIARAVVAELLDDGGNDGGNAAKPKAKTTLAGGLSPAHFVSVATPHLGCHAEAEATTAFVAATRAAAAAAAEAAAAAAAEEEKKQNAGDKKDERRRHHPALVPLVSWIAASAAAAGSAPSAVAPRLLAAAAARASASMGRSGPQFFLTDGGEEEGKEAKENSSSSSSSSSRRLPLLARLADPSLPALRALAAFESRTTFANSSGDHLVGWSNASLRDPRELPREELRAAAKAAAEAKNANADGGGDVEAAGATGGGGGGWRSGLPPFFLSRTRRSAAIVASAGAGGTGVVLDDGVAAAFEHQKSGEGEKKTRRASPGEEGGERQDPGDPGPDLVDRMLSALSSLAWRRVDVCFKGSSTPFLAHNHIQATHFFNEKVGRASADAIARAVVEADEELLRRRRGRRDEQE